MHSLSAFWFSSVVVTILAGALTAQAAPPKPPSDPPGPGNDVAPCIGGPLNMNLGALLLPQTYTGARGPNAAATLPGPITGGPAASKRTGPITGGPMPSIWFPGTVNRTGQFQFTVDLPDPATQSGYPFDFGLIYRTGTGEAVEEGLPPHWNFSFVDQVDVTYSGQDPTSLTWASGSGDLRVGTPVESVGDRSSGTRSLVVVISCTRHSERSRGLEDRAVHLREIDAHVLDLLADGESSFAALYYGLSRHWGHSGVDVDEALKVLQQLEDRHLVHARQMESDGAFRPLVAADYERAKREYGLWLPQATASEVAVDEIGLWYQITERGRQAWSQWSGSSGDDRDRWMLDDHADQGILEVRAGRKDVAEAALDRWLAEHGEVQEVSGTRESARIPEFVMRDGTRVSDGVLVTCRYRAEKR